MKAAVAVPLADGFIGWPAAAAADVVVVIDDDRARKMTTTFAATTLLVIAGRCNIFIKMKKFSLRFSFLARRKYYCLLTYYIISTDDG